MNTMNRKTVGLFRVPPVPSLRQLFLLLLLFYPPLCCRLRESYSFFRSVQRMSLFYYRFVFHVVIESKEISNLCCKHHQPFEDCHFVVNNVVMVWIHTGIHEQRFTW